MVDFPVFALIFQGIKSKEKFKFYFRKISAPFFVLVIWIVITAVPAINFGWAMAELSKAVRAYLVFLCVANHVKTQKDVHAIMAGFYVGILFEWLLAMWQWRIGPTPLMPFINEQFHNWRSTGTFYAPHYLANYLIMLVPILLRLFLFYKPQQKSLTKWYGVVLGAGVLTVLITFARGAWVSFAGAMALMFFLSLLKSKYRPKIKWALGLLIIFGAAFLIHYLPTIERQFGEERESATTIRFDQFRIARRMIKANPIFGTGLGNYELVSPNFVFDYEKADPRSWQFSEMVHNSYFFLTAQLGYPGILMFFWGIIMSFIQGFKAAASKSPYNSNIGIGLLTGLLAICIAFLAGPDIISQQLLVQIGFFIGMLVALNEQERLLQKKLIYLRRMKAANQSADGRAPGQAA
ncbi:O-antigen ligase family protein [candidate division KSB1 bacterium]|nr:O-antigen ligase family protein [candidate division KSB1 bacterium]